MMTAITPRMNSFYVVVDVCLSGITGSLVDDDDYCSFVRDKANPVISGMVNGAGCRHRLCDKPELKEMISFIDSLLREAGPVTGVLRGIVVSVPSGQQDRDAWKKELRNFYSCPTILLDQVEAMAIGMAELGFLSGNKTIGLFTAGTGVSVMIWKNGRKWHSGHIPDFDDSPCTGPENLLKIMRIACALYKPQEIFLPAQLASAGIIPDQQLKELVTLRIMEEGSTGIGLLGATALVAGESIAEGSRQITDYALLETERPYDPGLRLERGSASEIVEILWAAEEEAGEAIQAAFSQISSLATRLADAIADGGRIIYAGAGSSGRIAALDAVEIPCTYGLCKDRILTLIPGGISRAAIEMEEDSGEDESAVSEALLMNIGVKDVMIGISASGSARFVQSALALAKFRGAYTVMIQNDDPASTPPFCDKVIPLRSGPEVVAGSTRMKAGTSTKKVLNFLTTTAMIILGNVRGNHMINLECINQKLKSRAEAILAQLFDLSPEESKELLRSHNYQLKKACQAGPAGGKMDHDRDK